MPFLICVLIIPADRGATLCHTLFQPYRVNDLWTRFAAFIPGSGKRMIFARANGILEAKINWVKFQRASNLFHMTLDRPIALWHAIAAERAGRWCVGIHHIGINTLFPYTTLFR